MRVVAATNRDLRALVERGEFREDLYYRLCVVSIRVPALRDRPDEIPILMCQFLESFALRDRVPRPHLSAETMERLRRHHWPGNVRELENAIRQIVLLGADDRLLDDLLMRSREAPRPPVMPLQQAPRLPVPPQFGSRLPATSPEQGMRSSAMPPQEATPLPAKSPQEAMRVPDIPLHRGVPVPVAEAIAAPLSLAAADAQDVGLAVIGERARQDAERQAIQRALLSARWRRTDAARLLKINYRTLLRKMREYGLGRE